MKFTISQMFVVATLLVCWIGTFYLVNFWFGTIAWSLAFTLCLMFFTMLGMRILGRRFTSASRVRVEVAIWCCLLGILVVVAAYIGAGYHRRGIAERIANRTKWMIRSDPRFQRINIDAIFYGRSPSVFKMRVAGQVKVLQDFIDLRTKVREASGNQGFVYWEIDVMDQDSVNYPTAINPLAHKEETSHVEE